jgi:glycosyltransferase involved in cell wall biosynthesis
MNPRVTVVMPVYNRERFVDEAIASVIAQDCADFELLIVDDGSTDRTPEILRAWAQRDPRIAVLTSPRNQGNAAARNLGLAQARAPYVAAFDSDDIMMPRRLAAQAAVLAGEPGVVLVSCPFEVVDVEGRYLGTWRADEPHEAIAFLLNFYNAVSGGGQVMYRRSEVLAEGGYAAELVTGSDYHLWVRLLRRGRIRILPLIGMKQRQHDDRLSVQYANKRLNKGRIQRESLSHYLGRPIRDEELDAVLAVWRCDGIPGVAASADAVMREAYTRFCSENSDRALRRWVRARLGRQWMESARFCENAGHFAEAARYLARAARWSFSPDVARSATRLAGSLSASLGRKVLRGHVQDK